MAQDQQLKIRLDVLDNATKAFTSIKNSVFNLKNALVGLGAGAVVRSILKAGNEAQKLRSQFILLAPSVREGQKAFSDLQKFIARSPLESRSIELASSEIISLTKNSTDLISSMEAIQNASIAMGVPLETVAREFANMSRTGVDGARELRRKGLEELLGFVNGIKRDPEVAVKAFKKTFGKGGEFSLASDAFANTFEGATNRFFNSIEALKGAISDAGLLDYFTDLSNVISDFARDNPEKIKQFAKDFVKSFTEILSQMISFSTRIIAVMTPIFNFAGESFKKLYQFIQQFPPAVQEFGIVGFFLLGTKGKVAVVAIGGFLDTILDKFVTLNTQILEWRKSLGLVSKDGYEKIKKQMEDLRKLQQRMAKPETGVTTPTVDSFITTELEKKAKERLDNQQKYLEQQQKIKDATNITYTTFGKIANAIEQANSAGLEKFKNTALIIAKTLDQAITGFSEGIAQSIVLGKKLSDTFKEVTQRILTSIIQQSIEIVARKAIEIAMEKIKTTELYKQLAISKQIANTSGANSGGGLFGSLMSFGSSFFGGGISGSSAYNFVPANYGTFAEGGSVKGGEPITVGERGREVFMPKTDGTIIPSEKIGGVNNINFTIQSADVRGIKELLIDNRATITNIVNQALNSRGRPALI